MEVQHDHAANAACPPTCPAWAEGSLQLYAVQRRYAEMLEACHTAASIEYVYVWPMTPGAVLPEYLQRDEIVRLNLVVTRDTARVDLDDWGIRCELTFRGRRFPCALPWASIKGGLLRPPERRRPRFDVIPGGRKD